MPSRDKVEQIIFQRTNELVIETIKWLGNEAIEVCNEQQYYTQDIEDKVKDTLEKIKRVREMEINNASNK